MWQGGYCEFGLWFEWSSLWKPIVHNVEKDYVLLLGIAPQKGRLATSVQDLSMQGRGP